MSRDNHTCPVCYYPELRAPATHHLICPSCGVQFGYQDANRSHEELRAEWINAGRPWHSKRVKPPEGWNDNNG